jgi:hypothetical protein
MGVGDKLVVHRRASEWFCACSCQPAMPWQMASMSLSREMLTSHAHQASLHDQALMKRLDRQSAIE